MISLPILFFLLPLGDFLVEDFEGVVLVCGASVQVVPEALLEGCVEGYDALEQVSSRGLLQPGEERDGTFRSVFSGPVIVVAEVHPGAEITLPQGDMDEEPNGGISRPFSGG